MTARLVCSGLRVFLGHGNFIAETGSVPSKQGRIVTLELKSAEGKLEGGTEAPACVVSVSPAHPNTPHLKTVHTSLTKLRAASIFYLEAQSFFRSV